MKIVFTKLVDCKEIHDFKYGKVFLDHIIKNGTVSPDPQCPAPFFNVISNHCPL